MIKNLSPGSGISITNNHSTWPSFYNTVTSTGNGLVGHLRYNGSSQNLEVYDGNSWLIMNSAYPTIELSPHVQAVVAWAQTKMAEESRLKALAEKHPAVADAVDALKKAQEQVQIVAALVDTA